MHDEGRFFEWGRNVTRGIPENHDITLPVLFIKTIRESLFLAILDGFFPLIQFIPSPVFRDNDDVCYASFNDFFDDWFEVGNII